MHACLWVALGCVDALQSGGIVPIVEKVRGLIKNVWSTDISHRPTAASRDGQQSESVLRWEMGGVHVHMYTTVLLSLCYVFW